MRKPKHDPQNKECLRTIYEEGRGSLDAMHDYDCSCPAPEQPHEGGEKHKEGCEITRFGEGVCACNTIFAPPKASSVEKCDGATHMLPNKDSEQCYCGIMKQYGGSLIASPKAVEDKEDSLETLTAEMRKEDLKPLKTEYTLNTIKAGYLEYDTQVCRTDWVQLALIQAHTLGKKAGEQSGYEEGYIEGQKHAFGVDRERVKEEGRKAGREEMAEETRSLIEKHNARILNEFQAQGTPNMPMIAYDERVCLIPAMTKATEETFALLPAKEAHDSSNAESENPKCSSDCRGVRDDYDRVPAKEVEPLAEKSK